APDGNGGIQPDSPPLPAAVEFPTTELLAMEKDRLGAYLSGHPLSAVQDQLANITTSSLSEVAEGGAPGDVIVAGIITAYRKIITRSGRMMAFFTLEDLTGQMEASLLPDSYEKCGEALVDQAIVIVRGRAELDDRWREDREPSGQLRLLAEAIAPLDDQEAVTALRQSANHGRERNARPSRRTPRPSSQSNTPASSDAAAPAQPSQRIHIRVSAEAPPETVGQLKQMIGQFHGDTEVLLHIHAGQRERRLRLGPEYLVARGDRFTEAVRSLLGEGAIWVE
ncbi:MAG: hypothetical protein JSV79_04700, partial [Armatimonadota bacterium]